MKQRLINARVFDGEQILNNHSVLIEDGVIAALETSGGESAAVPVVDLGGLTLLPGFNDLQVNGGGGVLFNIDPSVETVRRIGQAHRQFGTTGFLPTFITADLKSTSLAIAAVREAMEKGVPGVLGIHLEGPFLNPARHGAHDPALMRELDEEGFELITSLGLGHTLVTLAPELTDTGMLRRLVEAGVVVCAGHSDADYARARAALDAGLHGFTHLYNTMRPMQSREPGMVGAALEDENSFFGIIADGHHVHPATLKSAIRAKQPGGALLVTDAMPTVGCDEKTFRLGELEICAEEGVCKTPDGVLAGSDLDMASAVRNARDMAGVEIEEAWRMASLYPARALGLERELGRIAVGYRASLVACNDEGQVVYTWIDGQQA